LIAVPLKYPGTDEKAELLQLPAGDLAAAPFSAQIFLRTLTLCSKLGIMTLESPAVFSGISVPPHPSTFTKERNFRHEARIHARIRSAL
jgi:hypothetical protein